MEIITYGTPSIAELTEEEQRVFYQTIYENVRCIRKQRNGYLFHGAIDRNLSCGALYRQIGAKRCNPTD